MKVGADITNWIVLASVDIITPKLLLPKNARMNSNFYFPFLLFRWTYWEGGIIQFKHERNIDAP